jgi:hypothetical protein
MYKQIALLAIILIHLLSAPLVAAARPAFVFFDINLGYRQDRLSWSIAPQRHRNHHFKPPRKISELSWKNIRSKQIMAEVMVINCHNFYFKGRGAYGKIFDGKETDRDFGGRKCHRILREKSKALSDQGNVYDLAAGVGYYFRFLCNRVQIAPIAGYSHSEQHFNMSNLKIVFDINHENDGFIPGLASNYRTRWFGPWIGADIFLKMTKKWNFYGSAEFHYVYFRAKGHWNLRTDFIKDFKHSAIGWGQFYTWGLNYDLLCNWNVGITGTYQSFRTLHGHDRTFLTDGPKKSKLRTVKWHAASIMGSLGFKY